MTTFPVEMSFCICPLFDNLCPRYCTGKIDGDFMSVLLAVNRVLIMQMYAYMYVLCFHFF